MPFYRQTMRDWTNVKKTDVFVPLPQVFIQALNSQWKWTVFLAYNSEDASEVYRMKFEHFRKFKCLYNFCFIFIRFSLCKNDTYWSKVLGVKVFLLSLEVKERSLVVEVTNSTLSVLREVSFMKLNIRTNLLCPQIWLSFSAML